MTPFIIENVICNDTLSKLCAKYIDSILHTCLTNEVHNWIEHHKEEKKFILRSFQIPIEEFDENIFVKCEMKISSTGFHAHKSTCEKIKKGDTCVDYPVLVQLSIKTQDQCLYSCQNQ